MSQGTQGAQTLRRSASFTLALAGSGSACAAALQPSPASSQAFQQELRVYQETVCSHSPFLLSHCHLHCTHVLTSFFVCRCDRTCCATR